MSNLAHDMVSDTARLAALRNRFILDTPPDQGFDQLTRLASRLLQVPVVLVSLVDEDRQFFKSCVGLAEPWASRRGTPLSHSFCRHAVDSGQALVIADSRRHPLVRDNPAIDALGVVAYAGIPLTTWDGHTLGTMCAIDHKPRQWTEAEVDVLESLAGGALARIELQAVAKEAERRAEALVRSEAYFRTLIEASMDVITILDADAIIRYQSPSIERVLGYAQEEILGRYCFELVHPDDLEVLLRAFQDGVTVAGARVAAEYRFRHKDGSWRLLESVGRNLLEDPLVRGIVVNSRDVTARRSLENQLRQAQKLEVVGQLTAGIAHDFNNVLSVVLANTQLVAESLPADRDDLRRELDDVRTATLSGANMIRTLMAFSRDAELAIAPHDLRDVVAGASTMLSRLLPAKIRIETSLPSEEAIAAIDPTAIQQVLMNLATNARDAMPEGGVLRIEVAATALDEGYGKQFPWVEPGPYHRFTVSDTGTGMDEETKRRVFEPFFTTKPAGQGTGLGMAMIHRLIRQHGGCVEVESEPGKGTTIALYVPAVTVAAVVARPPGETRPARGHGETVLLVEDQEAMRRTARRVLERFGYRVLLAADGQEALALVGGDGGAVDLVITDVEMPKLDGPGLYAELRRRGVRAAFVFASGHSAHRLEERFGQDPGVFVIQKPWILEDFIRTVRAALDRRA